MDTMVPAYLQDFRILHNNVLLILSELLNLVHILSKSINYYTI